MYINSRLLKVLELLKKNNITSIKEISEQLGITDRVVRYDIETLNFLLKINNLPEIKRESKGKLIFSESLVNNSKVEEFYKLNKHSKEERIEFIKAKLLIEGRINLTATSKILKVSRTSIRNDLTEISKNLEASGINISQNSVCDEEIKIRRYLKKEFSNNIINLYIKTKDYNSKLLDDYFSQLLMNMDKSEVKKIIKDLIRVINNKKQNYFNEIWIEIVISYLRLKQGFTIKEQIKDEGFIENSDYYKDLNNFMNSLEDTLDINYSKEERYYFIKKLIGILNNTYDVHILKNWIKIVIIIKKMIKNVSNFYNNIDIQHDEILINGLVNHIKPAIKRLKNNIAVENDIYMDVVEPYPELFKLVKSSLSPLKKIIGKEIVSSEIALIVVHFLASIERNRTHKVKKNKVLLVCGGGYGTSVLVSKQIKNLYNVEIKEIIYYSQFLDYNLKDIDIIITTLNLNTNIHKEKDVPIIKISPFLTVKDQKVLGKYLSKSGLNKSKVYEILDIVNDCVEVKDLQVLTEKLETALINKQAVKKDSSQVRLLDWINEDNIKVIDKVENWEQAIRESGKFLIESNDIEKEYITKIIDVANNFGVHFILDNGVAIPHGEVKKNVNKSSISILYVKEPVVFPEGKKAQLFFLIAAKTTKDHVKSIEDIISFVSHKEYVDKVLKSNTAEELKLRLENVFYKHIYSCM